MVLVSYLAEVTARSLGLAAAALLGVLAFRVKTAAARHAALTVVTAGMLLLAGLNAMLPAVPLRVLPAQRTAPIVPAQTLWVDAPFPQVAPAAIEPRTRARPSELSWPAVASALYLAVALLMLLRLAYGYLFTRRLARSGRREGDVYESSWISVPMTVGWLRPKILLPLGWKNWHTAKLEAVLAHERMHIHRADWAIAALAALNRCIFWFNPLAWWLERKLAFLAEQACDDAALLATGARETYAEALLDMAAAVRTGRGRMVWEAMAMAQTAEVKKRIERILDETREIPRGLTRGRWAALVAFSLPLMYLVSAARLAPAQAPVEMAQPQVAPVEMAQAVPPAASPQSGGGRGGVVASTPRPAEQQQQANRLLVLYFDLQDMSPAGHALAQANALRFLGDRLTPNDLVAVMANAGELKVLQDFTRDRDVLVQAVMSLPSGGGQAGAGPDDAEFRLFNSDRQLAALTSAVKMLATLPEKKEMLYFGSGLTRNGITNDAQLRATINVAVQANVAFYPVDASGNVAATPAGAASAPVQFTTEIGEHMVRASHEAPYPYRIMMAVEPVKKVDPVYPPEAMAAGIEGDVRFNVIIGTDGHVRDVKLFANCPGRACPPRELVAPAQEAVSQYVYEPPKAPNGEPAEGETMVTVPFRLKGSRLSSVADEVRILTQNYQAQYGSRVADSGADHPAQVLSRVEPEYPYAQRARGYQGIVNLEVTVGLDGVPKDIRVVRSDPAFNDSVIAAVRQWRFTPARQNGQAVESTVTLPVSFRLE